jgi:pimeloyl-ACP methyl ester carboxylesterase
MLGSHPDRAAVLDELRRPGALTASFGWYRANAHPRTIISPPPRLPAVSSPVMGVWGAKDIALTERQMTGSAAYVEGPWRYERLDGAGHWMQLDATNDLNALLLDFLA